jgi:hypothetical protein
MVTVTRTGPAWEIDKLENLRTNLPWPSQAVHGSIIWNFASLSLSASRIWNLSPEKHLELSSCRPSSSISKPEVGPQASSSSGTLATLIEGRTFDIGILRYCIDVKRQKMTFDIEIRYYTVTRY